MARKRTDMTPENFVEQPDKMTGPADVNSVLELIKYMIKYLRALPHIRDLKEPFQAITDIQIWLSEEKDKPWTSEEDSGLQGLQDVLQNDSRLTAKWKRLRLLVEPSTFAEKLRNTFRKIRDSCDKLQVPSKRNIVERLEKVILNLSDRGDLVIELDRAEAKFKQQFFDFLSENRSKSVTSEDVSSVRTWLAEQLGTDVDQELEEIKEHGGTLIEGLIVYLTELEERKCIAVDLVAETSGEGGESSDNFEVEAFPQPLDVIACNGVQALGLPKMARVLQGFANLIKCTKLPGGKFEVYKAEAIGKAISLAKTDGQYIKQAVKLLEALTSSREGVALGSERDDIYIEVSDHVDVLIELMKAKGHPEARLLAAKTVVNILVNQSVWEMVRRQYEIVSALVAISNEHPAGRSIHDWSQADRVCLLGLTRLTQFSNGVNLRMNSAGDKTQIIVTVLMKLLREGLEDDNEANLAKDSLVALDTQVLVMGHDTPTQEVWLLVRKHMSDLMLTEAFVSHSSVPGRIAIVSIMTKLCNLYEEAITEGLFLYLLKSIRRTGHEILTLLDSGKEQVEDRAKLLSLSVELLCFCVTHGQSMARSVLSKYAEERATLEKMLDEQDLGILNESRLKIMDVLDEIDDKIPTVAGGVAKLVKMFDSSAPASRPQIASRILKCVKEHRDEKDVAEMERAGVIGALMGLLKEENKHCQQNALLALDILSSNIAIQTDQLPVQTILDFLSSTLPKVRDAAVGLLDLMVKENTVDVKTFMETPEALKNTLVTLKTWLSESPVGPESASSHNSASVLLKMATAVGDNSVRLGILNSGLSILIKYVQKSQNDTFKELLIVMLSLICEHGKESDQEAVTKGGGHIFLLTSLQEIAAQAASKEIAAQALLSLIINRKTRGDVLEAGFVAIALDSVDQKFASTAIALGLANACSEKLGIDGVLSSKRGDVALLILMEHCPHLEGRGAAAAVIAKLYPLLTDSHRQSELTAACPHLVKYLELDETSQLIWFPDDKSQLCLFLKALAAFATERRGRKTIHEERGEIPLINYLKNKQIDKEVQDLMLEILTEMSYVFTEGVERRDSYYLKLVNVFLGEGISELVPILTESEDFIKNTKSMKNLLILIRNFSIAGQAAVTQLSSQGVVDVLLKVLTRHERDTSVSAVAELAVKALQKFMDEPSGKQKFIRNNGVNLVAGVLKLQNPRGSDVNSFATIILASVAKDPDTRKQACEAIHTCNILLALNNIMYDGETSRIKWQAAVLMKLLAMYGPTSKVCIAMKENFCLEALNQLKDVQHCREIANDVLRFVREKSKECRKEIDKLNGSR